jgi:Glycosyl transferases group 1
VWVLRELEVKPLAAGAPEFRFVVIGDGSEREWLWENLAAADLPGIQHGEELAQWYSNMDVLVFPSRTDTFGNVVLEAFASGGPATDEEFVERTARLLRDARCGRGWRRRRVRRLAGSRGIRCLRRFMRVMRSG